MNKTKEGMEKTNNGDKKITKANKCRPIFNSN
jgi:hypothetical protein